MHNKIYKYLVSIYDIPLRETSVKECEISASIENNKDNLIVEIKSLIERANFVLRVFDKNNSKDRKKNHLDPLVRQINNALTLNNKLMRYCNEEQLEDLCHYSVLLSLMAENIENIEEKPSELNWKPYFAKQFRQMQFRVRVAHYHDYFSRPSVLKILIKEFEHLLSNYQIPEKHAYKIVLKFFHNKKTISNRNDLKVSAFGYITEDGKEGYALRVPGYKKNKAYDLRADNLQRDERITYLLDNNDESINGFVFLLDEERYVLQLAQCFSDKETGSGR